MKNDKEVKIRMTQSFVLDAVIAEGLLKKVGISLTDAARLVVNFVELSKTEKCEKLLKIFELGNDKFLRENNSIECGLAFEKFVKAKSHLRERSLADYRNIMNVIFKKNPKIKTQKLISITSEQILKIIEISFKTTRQRNKARSVLHVFFAFAKKRSWCVENPVSSVDIVVLREREIVPLNLDEINRLLLETKKFQNGICLPAVSIMLFAGVRPREIERLRWSDIDWEENVISIMPEHSKTGGIRHVSILPKLRKILQKSVPEKLKTDIKICPKNWLRKWRQIRQNAGWGKSQKPWQQDVLRHTFASYHLKFFKNVSLLQCEMGHASSRLLRTRYLSMQGVTNLGTEAFWNGDFPL